MFAKNQSFVEPHDIELKNWYALTINPSQHIFKSSDYKNPFKIFKKKIKDFLKNNLFKYNYVFYIELSKKGRFHIHGRIQFLDLATIPDFYAFLDKYDKLIQYKFGDIQELHQEDPENQKYKCWDDYIKKQFRFWKKIGYDSLIQSIQPL